MLRSLCTALLAFACLFNAVNSQGLWSDIRTPQNQAELQKFYEATRPQTLPTAAPHYVAPPPAVGAVEALEAAIAAGEAIPAQPALLSPNLVSSVPVRRAPDLVAEGQVDVAASDEIARSVLKFAQNLSREINIQYRRTTIFSPLSIMSAFALLLLGAKGRSYSELLTVFGQNDVIKLHEQFGLMLNDVQQPSLKTTSPIRQLDNWHNDHIKSLRNYPRNRIAPQEVHIANGLFMQQGYSLNPDYRQAITQVYNSDLQSLDFERQPATAKYTINSWVEQHTKGKITDIISEALTENTRIVMANALYFKAMWEIDFIVGATRVQDFYPNGENTQPVIPVDMMVGAGSFPYFEDAQLNCRIVGLPYHGNLTTMYIIQPMRSSVEQLAYLQQSLTAEAVESMISQMSRRSIIMALPKMHITESFKLNKVLQRMGIGGIFSPIQSDLSLIGNKDQTLAGAKASFRTQTLGSGLASLYNLSQQRQLASSSQTPTPPSDLIVSDILHKVDFVVNEHGTEAAAASAAILKKSGPEVLFRAETPFIVLVRHDLTKLPLFYGLINEPPASIVSSAPKN